MAVIGSGMVLVVCEMFAHCYFLLKIHSRFVVFLYVAVFMNELNRTAALLIERPHKSAFSFVYKYLTIPSEML